MRYQDSDLSTQHTVQGREDTIMDSIRGHQHSTLGTLTPVLAHQDSIHGTLNSVTGYHDSILGTQNQFRDTGTQFLALRFGIDSVYHTWDGGRTNNIEPKGGLCESGA